MKKLKYFVLLLFVFACQADNIEVYEIPISQDVDVFAQKGTVVTNGSTIDINVNQEGNYLLSLEDEFNGIIYTNEKFRASVGSNKLNIHTKVLPSGSYRLLVKDSKNNIINETTIRL